MFLFAGEALSKFFNFILVFYFIARLLGDVGFGKFSTAYAFASLFLVFSDLGLTMLSVREIARNRDEANKYVSNIAVIKILLAIFTWSFVAMLVRVMGYPGDTIYAVYLLTLSLILNSFIESFSAVFRAYERMGYEALVKIFQRVLCTVLGIAALNAGMGLKGVVNVYFIASLVSGIGCYIILNRVFVKLRFNLDFKFWKKIIREALPIGIPIFFSGIYFRVDQIMLSVMKGDAVVGWYSLSYKGLELFMMIAAGFVGALFPVFSYTFKKSRESLLFMSGKAIKFLMVFIIPVAASVMLLSDKFLVSIVGESFVNSVPALKILIWADVIIFVNYVLTQLLIAINKQRVYAVSVVCCALFNVSLNFLLIPRLSYIGACITTVATEALLFILCFSAVSRHLGKIPLHKIIFKPLAATGILSLFLLYARSKSVMTILVVMVPLSIIIYLVLLRLFKTFDKDDAGILKSFLEKGAKA